MVRSQLLFSAIWRPAFINILMLWSVYNFFRLCITLNWLTYNQSCRLYQEMLTLEESWQELKYHLLMARELYVPKFKVPRKVQPKWFDSNCARTKRRRFRSNNRDQPAKSRSIGSIESEVSMIIIICQENFFM